MEFKTLFKILKNRIGDGCDVPEFFRELIAMITAVSEEEWGTGKDPSMRALLDNTYRSYVKRKLPKKFAQSIVYHLNMDNLIRNINDTPLELRKLLVEDLIPYDSDMTVHNVAEKIADYMIEIIRASAGMTNPNTLIESKRQEIALSLKRKYGDFLYLEEGNCCPGCGRNLYVMLNDSVRPVYEIAIIDKSKSPVVTNLLAMCPICQATHAVWLTNQQLKNAMDQILCDIETQLNDTMQELNDSLFDDIRKAPKLRLKQYNSYTFETPDDNGTGSNYKGLVIYDLAVLECTELPAIAHDSLILKNISDVAINGIMRIYEKSNRSNKQIFIAFDKQNAYGKSTQQILSENTVLKLSDKGHELYGESWNKKVR